MITAGEFRNGVTFMMDGDVCQVVEFQHVKPGKGAAFVRTKFRNLKTGATVERSFNPTEKFENAQLQNNDMSYIYRDDDLCYFMDTETYEQLPIMPELIGDPIKFLKEGMVCRVLSHDGEILSIELPYFVELEIVECEPAVRGDTAQNASKNATLETGAVIRVPLFIENHEVVRIDTRTGDYMERAKK
ncbi:MAG: elongation factor P [Eubacteriales bacterium]|nr:elongation factor P [Eubacteriales bacterium]